MDLRVKTLLDGLNASEIGNPSIPQLARRVNLSPSRLSALFKRDLGLSIKQLLVDDRFKGAARLLVRTHMRVSEIAYEVGCNDLSNFTRAFGKRLGLTPKEYRKRYQTAGLILLDGTDDLAESEVVLVDEADRQVGVCGKRQAHTAGVLHRAFSIFIFNAAGQLLLQRRALSKYHSGGLWSNTCCSHPAPGADVSIEAVRRLLSEMGFSCPLEHAFAFVYRADVEGGLIEHEFDHVFVGCFERDPDPDPQEVQAWAWKDLPTLRRETREHPERFTTWFRSCFERAFRAWAALGNRGGSDQASTADAWSVAETDDAVRFQDWTAGTKGV